MRICWDNLEKARFTKNGNFNIDGKGSTYYYYDTCLECGEPFLGTKTSNKYCGKECSDISDIRRQKQSVSHKDNVVSIETRQKISDSTRGEKNPNYGRGHLFKGDKSSNWRGGVKNNDIPLYDRFVSQLEPYEQCRCKKFDGLKVLEVKCTYCDRWYQPSSTEVTNRIHHGIYGKDTHRFYCSDNCKSVCPLFRKTSEQLERRDMIAAGHILPDELNREVQPQLRQMTLAPDEYLCVKCDSEGPLHCHHIDPVAINPIESADIDNCITLCVVCHKEAHRLPGCGYNELRNCA